MTSITPQNPFDTYHVEADRVQNASLVSENLASISKIAENNNAVKPSPIATSSSNIGIHNQKLPATPSSPKRNTNLGLSELSKQLRSLQAKNEGQAVEIDRLERQLRILADLQGISVGDLRKALSDACQSEAYGELQNRVAALRAQLEAASLAKQRSVEQDSAAHQVANLELRIGELEEVEQDLRSQVSGLYGSLKEQTANASRFESTCKQQELEIQRLKLETTKQMQPAPLVPAPPSAILPAAPTAMTAASQLSQQIVPASVSAIVASPADMELLAESARLAKVEAQVNQDKLVVSEQQLESTEKQYKLKEAQFKARSMVQEERIDDLEQQLNSLYVAFEMLRQEHNEGEATRAALQTSLNDADSRVAQQVNANDVVQSSPTPHVQAVAVPASPEITATASLSPPPTPAYMEASPLTRPETRHSIVSQSSHTTPPMSRHASIASTPPLPREDGILMSGVILVKSTGILRAWKKKHATLYQGHSDFELVISDALQQKADKSYILEPGIATLHRFATQRFAFIIREDPQDREAAVIYAAATNEKDYIQWMSVLKVATTGDDYNPHDYNVGFNEAHMLPASSSTDFMDDQEAKDLEAALRLSTQQM